MGRLEPAPTITKSSRNPEISINLARLVGAEQDGHSSDESDDRPRTVSPEPVDHESPQDARANFVGESWYASYVLNTSVADPATLHRHIERRRSKGMSQGSSENQGATVERLRRTFKKAPPSDLPPQHLTERLLEAYFKRFHVFCPILDRATFLSSVGDGSVSITLLRCVLFVASIHCEPEIFHLMGYTTRLDVGDELFGKACASFDSDQESDRTTMVLSSFLLHYFFGRPTSYRDALWWLSNAIRSAQCMSYHRSTKNSRMSQRDKSQWKRVWWCLYVSRGGSLWLFGF